MRRDLDLLAEDLVALSCCRALDSERVTRVLRLLQKPNLGAPLRVSEAAGPLPVTMSYAYALTDGRNVFGTFMTTTAVSDEPDRAFFPELSAVV